MANQGFRAVLHLSPRRRRNARRHTGDGTALRQNQRAGICRSFSHGAGTAQSPSLKKLEDGGAGVAYAVLSDGEVAECCLRMIASGVFDRHPNLQIVIRSSGGGIPLLLHRFFWKHKGPEGETKVFGNLSRTFSDRLRQLRRHDPGVPGAQDGREQYRLRFGLLRRSGSAEQGLQRRQRPAANPEHFKRFTENNSRRLLHL